MRQYSSPGASTRCGDVLDSHRRERCTGNHSSQATITDLEANNGDITKLTAVIKEHVGRCNWRSGIETPLMAMFTTPR